MQTITYVDHATGDLVIAVVGSVEGTQVIARLMSDASDADDPTIAVYDASGDAVFTTSLAALGFELS